MLCCVIFYYFLNKIMQILDVSSEVLTIHLKYPSENNFSIPPPVHVECCVLVLSLICGFPPGFPSTIQRHTV